MTYNQLCADKNIVAQFITEITNDWPTASEVGLFEIRCLGEHRTPVVQQFTLSELNDAVRFAADMNSLKLNVYMVINPIDPNAIIASNKGATDGDILRAHYSFADADDQRGVSGITKLSELLPPDITVTTGTIPHLRCHAYWKLSKPCYDLQEWTDKQASIAAQFGTDPSIINPSRLMRVAGTISYPSSAKERKGYTPELVALKTGINQCL